MFEKGQVVRILTIDGHVSPEEYKVETPRADRRGHIALTEINKANCNRIKVTQRRILPKVSESDSIVIEYGDKYRAVCPNCSYTGEVLPSDDFFTCPKHGQTKLYWKGDRPIMNQAATKQTKKTVTKKQNAKKTTTPKKKAVEPVPVDLQKLARTQNCELWSKPNVPFDHANVNVKSHCLLFVSKRPRKLCFNTYDNTTGKKGKPLPVQEFLNNRDVPGSYPVKDLEKQRETLIKKGYERVK